MVTDKIKELQDLQARAADLQKKIDAERQKELAGLPAQYGYDSVEAFVKAVRSAAGGKGKKGGRKATKAATPGKRTRVKITPELKAKVIEAVKAGKTGSAIASELGLSVPSIQNIKKEAGLVKARESAASPSGAAAAS